MRRSTTTALVVLVLAVAGCSGFVGGTSQEGPEFAPGVTEERVTNASLLADANRAVLDNTSFTYVGNYSQRVDAEGYRYAVDHDVRVWAARDGSYLYRHHGVVRSSDGESNRIDGVWANGTIAVSRTVDVSNGSVTYARYRPPDPYPVRNVTRSDVASALENATVVETENESGTAYARVRATESETRRTQAANGTAVNVTTRRNATATVREDGFVPALDATYASHRPLPVAATNRSGSRTDRPLARVTDTTRTRYAALGSTQVPRPGWVETALAATEGLSPGERTRPMATNASS